MKNTKKLVQTALFIALAVVVHLASQMIPIGGLGGMRIGFSGIFTKMPALLFGPIIGGISAGAVDFLSFLVKPQGNFYLVPMLFVMILGGVITGVLWKVFKNVPSDKIRVGFICVCTGFLVIGIFNHITLTFIKSGLWYDFISALKTAKADKTVLVTYGLYIAALLGFIFIAIDFIAKKKSKNYSDNFLSLLLTIFVSDIIVTTLNTFVLIYFGGLSKVPFWTLYIPRVIPDLISAVLFAYIISVLLKVYNKIINR